MADFRMITGQTGLEYIAPSKMWVVERGKQVDIALWGGGPSGEALVVSSSNPGTIDLYETSYVATSLGRNMRRFRVVAKQLGECTVSARLGAFGGAWAEARMKVAGTVMPTMKPAQDAPTSGSIPVAAGGAAVVRIPVPGTNGLCVEFYPRGWTPKGGSTSTLFIQDAAGKRTLRLDYGFNTKTGGVDYHWNQKATFKDFGVADHSAAGKAGELLYKGARYYRVAGRLLLVVGVAMDIYSIAVANKPLRRAAQATAGWAAAWAACKGGGAIGAWAGTAVEPGLGTAIGAVGGCIVGGFIGYEGASAAAGWIYDWAEGTIFTPVQPEAAGAVP